MRKSRTAIFVAIGIVAVIAIFFAITYNSFVTRDEKVKLTWNEMQNAYQRRLDLIPSLVNTVKGGALFEQNTLVAITEARARATAVTVSATPSSEAYTAQANAQDQLAASANRLLINVENYPALQGTRAFRTLQTQLERTELRIKIARKDFNAAVQDYNSSVRGFPKSFVAGMTGFRVKTGFTSDAGAEKATEIKF